MISVHYDARASVALTRIHLLLPLAEFPPIDDSSSASVSAHSLSHSLRGFTQWQTEPISPRCFVLLWHCPWTYCPFFLWSLASDCILPDCLSTPACHLPGMYTVALYSFSHIVLPFIIHAFLIPHLRFHQGTWKKIIQLWTYVCFTPFPDQDILFPHSFRILLSVLNMPLYLYMTSFASSLCR